MSVIMEREDVGDREERTSPKVWIEVVDIECMTLVVTRWTRFGHDRLYCNEDKQRLGFYDLESGQITLNDSSRSADVNLAIRTHMANHGLGKPDLSDSTAESVALTDLPPPVVTDSSNNPEAPPSNSEETPADLSASDEDLRNRRPGHEAEAAAKATYEAEVAEAPVRARIQRLTGSDTAASWRKGAAGEREVGRLLERKLPKDWTVIHSIPVGQKGTDIDHVVIGPGGVLTVNTKNHQDQRVKIAKDVVRVNRRKYSHIRAARSEARKASQLLSKALGWDVPVTPMLAIICDGGVSFDGPPPEGIIISSRKIPKSIKKLPRSLAPLQVAAIVDAASKKDTWKAK